MTLAPHDHTYCLPSHLPPSRPVSPSGGYNSDPETGSGVRNVRISADCSPITDTKATGGTVTRKRGKRRNGGNATGSSMEGLKTVGWQDLLK